ncbi:phosphotransferase [Pseudactinotalea terrae]|uniref:phosphotransferase n=1 Tax=Pseudactinotalea terrae TaxID=1743262 RepID=UPI0012E0EEED|nr:phosphotransferase [Pseudactinotalea terrae]
MRTPMHDDETLTDAPLARRLLAEQAPQWADLPLAFVEHFGTDHDVYRLGADMSLRLPRSAWAGTQAAKESTVLAAMAHRLSLPVPEVLLLGEPTEEFPHPWSVQRWLPGAAATEAQADPELLAADLATFVLSLRTVPIEGAPPLPASARGGELALHDEVVGLRIAELGQRVEAQTMVRAWEESRSAVGPSGAAWTHGDLLPGNLLLAEGRLSGVIDFGALNVTDPALDLTPCWYLFDGVASPAGQHYLTALEATEADVRRARGWAQLQALNARGYYEGTNPGMAGLAERALALIAAEA